MTGSLRQQCHALLVELGIIPPDGELAIRALTGGVASDIAMIDLKDRKLCAKFALAKLKVAEDWRAPVHRNRAEYEWLTQAARIVPESSVRLMGHSAKLNGFAMEYIAGENVTLWKAELLDGRGTSEQAVRVGDVLGRIHHATAQPGFDVAVFQNRDDFRALRIEPYLTFTAHRHPDVAGILNDLADALYDSRQILVHGDVSPKNILFRDGNPILLDAECATMGDASFDVGFCLNHLILKAVHLPALRMRYLQMVSDLWDAYALHIDWEQVTNLEQRVCRLVPVLMLARIDGKSPVEYLDTDQRDAVRALALPLIETPASTLPALAERISTELTRLLS